jgi:hypothetical protein
MDPVALSGPQGPSRMLYVKTRKGMNSHHEKSPITALFGTLPEASQHFWSPRYNIPCSQFFAFVLFMSLWFSDWGCFGIFCWRGHLTAFSLFYHFLAGNMWGHASFVLLIMLDKTMCSFVMLAGCYWLSFQFSHVETNSAVFVVTATGWWL